MKNSKNDPKNTIDNSYLIKICLVINQFKFGLAIIAAIASAIYDRIPKIVKPSFKPKLKDRVPCDRCHYFNHDRYLKCAVHPDTAMTEQAVDCRDYDSDSTRMI